jgi:hypothetical protein
MMHMQRGQALVETAFFLPVLLLAMMAIIYFSQYGVLQSRAVEAVRYASLVTNPTNDDGLKPSPYSIEAVYEELHLMATKPGVFPSSSYACATTAGPAAAAAFVQAQSLPAGTAAATAPPWFKGSTSAPPSGNCVPFKTGLPLSSGDAAYAGNTLLTAQVTTLTASQPVPGFLLAFSKVSGPTGPVGAGMAFPYSDPSSGDYCTPGWTNGFNDQVGKVVGGSGAVGYAPIPAVANPAPVPAGC